MILEEQCLEESAELINIIYNKSIDKIRNNETFKRKYRYLCKKNDIDIIKKMILIEQIQDHIENLVLELKFKRVLMWVSYLNKIIDTFIIEVDGKKIDLDF